MHYLLILLLLFFTGCSLKQGDYVSYSSNDYNFIRESFKAHKVECVYMGEIKQTNMEVNYCKGVNYANKRVDGFIFHHSFNDPEKRFIGAKLFLKTKKPLIINCSSHVNGHVVKGDEYVVCMVSQKEFMLSDYLISQENDVVGTLITPIGKREIYSGTINDKAKDMIKTFVHSTVDKSIKTKEI